MWSFSEIRSRLRFFYGMSRRTEAIYAMLNRMYREPLLAAEKAADPLVLAPYGFSAYSQSDDDGMIEELFRRIGTTNRQFIDFGCAEGIENNTTYLILTGWNGLWMDGSDTNIESIQELFAQFIASGKLRTKVAFIIRENINSLLREAHADPEPDLLSIDLDGNDYWIWDAIDAVRARAVVVEYNAVFRPPHQIVQEYDAAFHWKSDAFYGASLKALEVLATKKGYALVGCNFAGSNAYFVRADLASGKFSPPFTAEHHYREPMYDAFVRGYSRHRKAVGRYRNLAE